MPVDHEIFEQMNQAQLLWYYYSIEKDKIERFERDRDNIEYLASFMEPEAVRQVRDGRKHDAVLSDKEFDTSLEALFGRKLSKTKKKIQDIPVSKRSPDEYKVWSEIKLD